MHIQVGGSLRKALGEEMLDAASHWPICEVVPENWDPNNPTDVATLKLLGQTTEILLHSLSLNVLGHTMPDSVIQSARAWCEILGLDLVTDHFCWSATDDHYLGVFVPPTEGVDILKKRVRALKKAIGRPFGLENICLSADDANFCSRYHRTLTEICKDEGVMVLLDLENLRLDALSSGVSIDELLSYYDDNEISGYHVAGSTVGELILDTHDQPTSDETLQILLRCYKSRPKPVIYERDYALNVREIDSEVKRIEDWLRRKV